MIVINNTTEEKVFHVFKNYDHHVIIYNGFLTADDPGTNPRRFYIHKVKEAKFMDMNKANPKFGYAIGNDSPLIPVANLAWDKNGNPNIVAVQPF